MDLRKLELFRGMFNNSRMLRFPSILLLACGLLLCSCSQRGFKWNPSAIRMQTAPATMDGEWCKDYFMVLATIDDRGPFRLLLDTGAALSLLDDDAAARLGVRVSPSSLGMTGGGGATVRASGQVRIGQMVSGGVTLRDFDMVVHDLARFEPILGPLDGVLGYSTLKGSTFTIDYPARTVTVTNETLDPDAPRRANEAWFTFNTSRPHIVGDVAGRRIALLADSGSGGGFDFEAYDDLPRTGDDRPSHAAMNLDRLVLSRSARLDGAIQLGPIVYDAPAISTDPKGSKIGAQVMSQFRWTFDTRAKRVRIDRGPARIGPEPVIHLGFLGARKKDAVVVVHVAPDSAAHANGLRKGDRIVAINGVEVETCSCDGMGEAIERATPAVLSVERGGEKLSIEAPPYTVVP